jgi:hypothetical protein
MGPNIHEKASMWTTPDVCSGARDMSKIDPELQKRADTKRTTGLPTEVKMWLTPIVPSGGRSVPEALVRSNGMTEDGKKRTVVLESQVRYWAIPTSSDNSNRTMQIAPSHGVTHGLVLAGQAASWPTPKATDGTKGGPNQAGSKGDLMASVEHRFSLPAQQIAPGQESSPDSLGLPQPSTKRLNPYFGEHLMGWPEGWTSTAARPGSGALETALWRSALQQQLSNFFNGQDS